jgi:hypothetical protein
MTAVRCTHCQHFVASVERCAALKEAIGRPNRRRLCASFRLDRRRQRQALAAERRNRASITDIHTALADAGLAHHVLDLRDTHEGRLLRLVAGVPTAERFRVYELCGLGVAEPRHFDMRRRESATASAGAATGSRRAA